MSHSTQPGRWNGSWYRADLAKLFSVSRAIACRVLDRHQNAATPSTSGGR
ncbi:hypothetical protein ACWCQ1_43935 [Streptomyces sp. NPDC002144]